MKQKKFRVKRNQIWKKRDTGMLVEVCQRHNGDYWSTKNLRRTNNGSLGTTGIAHHITEKHLIRFWDLVS